MQHLIGNYSSSCSSESDSEQIPKRNSFQSSPASRFDSTQDTPNTTEIITNEATPNTYKKEETESKIGPVTIINQSTNIEPVTKTTTPSPSSPKKRKLEPVALQVIDETREKTTTDIVYTILMNQGYLNSSTELQVCNTDVDPELQEKISKFTLFREQGMYFNDRLLNTHAFCNPLIMNKMISFMELDSYDSELTKDEFDLKSLLALPSAQDLLDRKQTNKQPLSSNPYEATKQAKSQLKSNFQKTQWNSIFSFNVAKGFKPKRRI